MTSMLPSGRIPTNADQSTHIGTSPCSLESSGIGDWSTESAGKVLLQHILDESPVVGHTQSSGRAGHLGDAIVLQPYRVYDLEARGLPICTENTLSRERSLKHCGIAQVRLRSVDDHEAWRSRVARAPTGTRGHTERDLNRSSVGCGRASPHRPVINLTWAPCFSTLPRVHRKKDAATVADSLWAKPHTTRVASPQHSQGSDSRSPVGSISS